MARSLSKTVVAGGVVYPAGTPATAELEKLVTNPDHWTDAKAAGNAGSAEPKRATSKRTSKSQGSKDD